MKVVLLAGGLGTRISEESIYKPKPLVEIGGKPIIWHIMKIFSYYGHNEFIICAGYKQHLIKEWFSDYFLNSCDISFDYRENKDTRIIHECRAEPWKVTIVDTGKDTMTGGRIKRIEKYVKDKPFLMTYADGVCDVDINKLIEFHNKHGKIATITTVRQDQTKGILEIGEDNSVKFFREKNLKDSQPINAGFMVLEPKIFNYIDNDETIFEKKTLEQLASEGQLMSYMHKGFWQCMDNLRERNILEQLLSNNLAPWVKWQ